MALNNDIFGRQLGQESGGHQFNPDGTVVRSPKGATGIAQVMPTTGPEAARLAGLPWDANKFENDAEYNRQLGAAYKTHLLDRFNGDERLATAAYNAGPTRVANLRQQFGADWEAHLPAETKDYLGKVLGGGRSPMPIDTRNPLLPKTDSAGLNDGGNDSPVMNPFTAGPDVQKRQAAVESELAGQQAFLQQQSETVHNLQEERRARTERVVHDQAQILDSVEQGNRALLENVKPLLSRQQMVADRLGKLATMNPLERGIRSIFDLNYNQDYLQGVNKNLLEAIQSQGQNYQFVTSLQDQYMKQLQAGDENAAKLENLSLTELDENGKMVAQGLNSAINSFDFLNKGIEANGTVIRAQILARSNMLDQMNPGQIGSLLEQAQKSPDRKVTVDGITIGSGELQQRQMQWDQSQLALESAKIAIGQGRLDIAEKQARRLADTMTEAQLQEAAAHNGVYQGVQIPSDAITAGLHNFAVRREIQTGTMLQKGGYQTGVDSFRSTMHYIADTRERMQSFGGQLPPGIQQTSIAVSNRLSQMMDQLTEAQKQGLGDTVGQAQLQEIQQLRTAYDKELSNVASRYAGGSPLGTQVMTAYLKGDPINSNEGISMMQEFVKQGGLPTAMQTSPTFRAVYQSVDQAGQEVDKSAAANFEKLSEAERSRRVTARVKQLAPNKVNSANFEQLFQYIPAVAKSLNHPFAGVSRDELLMAQQRGNAEAYTQIGTKLGVSAMDAQKIFSGSWQKPANMDASTYQRIVKQAASDDMKAARLRIQRESFLNALDEGPSAKNGFKPSHALIDLMSSNGFMQKAQQFQQTQARFSFGDAVASSMGDGNLVQSIADYAGSLRGISNSIEIQRIGKDKKMLASYSLVPENRTKVILGAMDELTPHDETTLLQAMHHAIPGMGDPNAANPAEVNASIRNFIVGQKFKDPNLERIRKIAASNWDTTAKTFDSGLDRINNDYSMIRGGLHNPFSGFNQ